MNATVTSATVHLASYAVSALWQIPLLSVAGWLAARVLRRLSPAAEHNVWEMTLLLCVLIPALPAPRSTGHAVTVKIAEAGVRIASSEQTGTQLGWHAPVWVPVVAVQVICVLWALTTLFAAIRFVVALLRTRSLVAAASECVLPPELEVWHDCLRRFGLQQVRVLTSPLIAGPMTATLRGHALLLPEGFADELGANDFRAAALHECAHMQRNDFRSNLAYGFVTVPVAFHPVLRLIKRQLVASREIACDRAAAEVMGNAGAYRSALLRLATRMAADRQTQSLAMGAAVGIFDSNSLEERMERLSTPAKQSGTPTWIALTTVAAVCLAGTAFAAAVGAVRLAPLTYSEAALPFKPVTSTVVNQTVKVSDAPKATAPQKSSKAVQAPAKPAVYAIGGDVSVPRLVHQVDPDFPQEAREKLAHGEFAGECLIGLVVDPTGMPQDVHVAKSLGKGFDENALAAVRQYRFKPGTRHGQPVAVALNISVNFQLF